MPWWVIALIAVVAILGVWRFLGCQPLGKKQTRYDLEHHVKGLLVLSQNGGLLDIRHRASPFRMQIFRQSGDDSKAEVVVSVPRESWSDGRLPELRDLFDRQGVPHTTRDNELLHDSSLIEARLQIPRIWVAESGSKPARVGHLVLDLFGIGPAELLDVRYEYTPSDRWKRHRNKLAEI